jgi:carbonic anhydrase/acetyltransferase-like protein (isoleucine patch superfamily)
VFVGAILVVGPNASISGRDSGLSDSHENLAGHPLASIEVLGQSLLQRTISRLHGDGIRDVAIISDRSLSSLIHSQLPGNTDLILVNRPTDVWSAAQRTFAEFAENGAESVLLIRLGAYVEFDLEQLLDFHREQSQPVTPFCDQQGPLDYWVLSASPDVAGCETIQGGGVVGEAGGTPFQITGYVNRMISPRDLRKLAVDSFLGRCQIKPSGIHLKPGIWVDDGAQVHRRARIVAPAYIGRNVKVQANALVTRCSNLERGCEVGYGTVVEDASILRDTCLGTGLDVTHAVVWGRNLINLRYDVALEINDPKLVSGPTIVRPRPLHPIDQVAPVVSDVPAVDAAPAADISEVDLNLNAGGLRDAAKDAKPAFVSPRRNAWAG